MAAGVETGTLTGASAQAADARISPIARPDDHAGHRLNLLWLRTVVCISMFVARSREAKVAPQLAAFRLRETGISVGSAIESGRSSRPATVRFGTNRAFSTSSGHRDRVRACQTPQPPSSIDVGRVPPVAREIALGVAYWLVFLLVLEPDNVSRALAVGKGPSWSLEILRIVTASLLGACTAPFLFWLGDRFPVQGKAWRQNAGIQAGTAILLSAFLIVISCVLADWMLPSEHRPFLTALREVFVSNWLLLSFCIAGFIAIVHAIRFFHQLRDHELADAMKPDAVGFLRRFPSGPGARSPS